MLWVLVGSVSGFLAAFGLLFIGATLSTTIWLAVALICCAAFLLRLVPATRELEQRICPLLVYSGLFGIGWVMSVQMPGRNQDTPWARVLLASFILMIVVSGVWMIARRHPVLTNGWLLASFVLGFLSARFSGSAGGSGGSWELWLMEHLSVSADTATLLVIAIRKTVHFTFYGTLAYVAYRAVGDRSRNAIRFGLGFALLHALYDEARQLYAANRTGQFGDVLLDASGAVTFILLVRMIDARRASSRIAIS